MSVFYPHQGRTPPRPCLTPHMEELVLPVGPRDHVRGRRDAPITLVEYADVECPYCGSLERVLQKVLARREDVRLVYRHFPLVGPHPHAYSAALALEAAAEQGRFWELHDLLLSNQDSLGRAALTGYAEQLGLEPDSLLRPATDRYDAEVRDDFDSGVASGVEGTPGLFVNGVRLRGKPTLERILDAAGA
jgi:NhaA family Na+:H+ antiporter